MSTDDKEQGLLAIKAAEWVERLPRATEKERAEFVEWLRQSPRHVQEILLAMSWDDVLRDIDVAREIDLDALIRKATSNIVPLPSARASTGGDTAGANAQSLSEHSSPMTRTRRWWSTWAAIPAAVAVFVTVMVLFVLSLDSTVITGDPEWKTVELADGSLARLAPLTELRFEFTGQHRLVRLSRGQAMFYVRKDVSRPFLVETETATAQAIGTAFGVTQLAEGPKVTVTVREGVVAVSKRSHAQARDVRALPSDSIPLVRIVAGEQAVIENQHPIAVRTINLPSELSWAEERLVLKGTLGDAVRAFNLRNHHQLIVTDPSMEKASLRGIMDAWDPQSLVATLESTLHVRVERRGDETFLLPPLTEVESSPPQQQPQQEL